MSHSQVNSDLDDRITLLYLMGHSTYKIADRFGIDRKHVRRALQRTSTPLRSKAEAIKLYREFA